MRRLKIGFWFAVITLAIGGLSIASAADSAKKRIVFVAGPPSHGYGEHEHNAGCLLLAKAIQEGMPHYEVAVHSNGWPDDPHFFDGADAVVIYSDGGEGHPAIPHMEQVDEL